MLAKDFMSWKAGELRTFYLTFSRKRKTYRKQHKILAPYDRLLAQLVAEERHGRLQNTHEALRRRGYACRVLDAFVAEFESYTGPAKDFRSKVLTPILQRQLIGASDANLVPLRKAIGSGDDDPTIGQTTDFYLGVDPTDPKHIPAYRFNMVFIPEMRWHLATVLDVIHIGDFDAYNSVGRRQDLLLALIKGNPRYIPRRRLSTFEEDMIKVIEDEQIDIFFRAEIEHVVCAPNPLP